MSIASHTLLWYLYFHRQGCAERGWDHGKRIADRSRTGDIGLSPGGGTNGEIADALSISEATVKTHVRNVRRKLGIHGHARAGHRLPHVPVEITPGGYGHSTESAYSEVETAVAAMALVELRKEAQMSVSLERVLTTLMGTVFVGLTVVIMLLVIPVLLVAVPVGVLIAVVVSIPAAAVRGSLARDHMGRGSGHK